MLMLLLSVLSFVLGFVLCYFIYTPVHTAILSVEQKYEEILRIVDELKKKI
jgi:chromosome condensin MukBEF MukE localization factor